MRVHVTSFIPCASTPDLADDEDSDNEGVLQRVTNFNRFKETSLLKKGIIKYQMINIPKFVFLFS